MLGLFMGCLAFAGEHMNVAVCKIEPVPTSVIKRAEAVAGYLFATIGVEVRWSDCQSGTITAASDLRPDFIFRVRASGQINRSGPTSIDLMGRAFVDAVEKSYLADVYYGAIQEVAVRYSIVDADHILGYTMAHELGHLLMGTGHEESGIMRSHWGKKELDAIQQGYLKFSKADREAILRKLRSSTVGPAIDVDHR